MIKEIIQKYVGKCVRIGVPKLDDVTQIWYKKGYINQIIENFIEFEVDFDVMEYIEIEQIKYLKEIKFERA